MSARMSAIVISQLTHDFVQRWGRKLGVNRRIVPWMRQKEFGIFKEIIVNHQPLRCLEWGAGYSTLYFPTLLPTAAQWHAIEHNTDWAARIASLNRKANVMVHRIAPTNSHWQGDGTPLEFEQYLKFPQQFHPFDLIVVDGRARKACLDTAPSLLSDRGVVILHDANRTAYHAGFAH